MKTLAKLLYVEPQMAITDLIDLLRDLDGEEAVALVVPEGALAFQSAMSAKLLKRYADIYGKRVSLISGDPRVRTLAQESGFSAYPSLAAYDSGSQATERAEPVAVPEPVTAMAAGPAREEVIEAPKVRPATVISAPPRQPAPPAPPVSTTPKKPSMDRRPFFITAGAFLLLAFIGGVVFLPTAAVTVSVAGTPLKVEPQLMGAVGTAAGSPDHFATQALNVVETSSTTTSTTGQKPIAAVAASGAVVFSNKSSQAVIFKKDTLVGTDDGVRFRTQKPSEVVEPATKSKPVPISAEAAGQKGNVPAGRITIVYPIDPDFSVSNLQPTTGGIDEKQAAVLQQSDIDVTRDALLTILNPKVQQGMDAKGKGLRVVQIPPATKVEVDHKVNDEVSSFTEKVTVTSNAIGFDDAAVKKMLLEALKRMVPENQQLTESVKLSYEPDTSTATADGHVTLKGHADGYTIPRFSQTGMRSYIKGRSPSSAHARLASLPSVVDVVIRQEPFALPWLPFFSSRIAIRVQEVSGTATQ